VLKIGSGSLLVEADGDGSQFNDGIDIEQQILTVAILRKVKCVPPRGQGTTDLYRVRAIGVA
jgi:hypothetical protein